MKTNKLLSFILILLIVLAVFMLNMTFVSLISETILMVIRIVLIVLFFIAWRVFHIKKQAHAKDLAFTLMVVNLAFFIVSFFTANLWNLNLESARGVALMKLSDSFFICIVLIFSFLIAGYRLKDLYLAKGRLTIGLIIGFLAFILMGFLALNNPEKSIKPAFLTRNLVWILIFVLSNGFMEELLFRGIFLRQLDKFFKPIWSIVLTALVFGASHMQVTYTPDVLIFVGIVLILGLIWGFLMHYTKSIIASMLFHAGADLMIIIPVYSSFGVKI
jgi:membrane protease YdiL (CAAX protease family)